jgi:serine/threonine protein kinase
MIGIHQALAFEIPGECADVSGEYSISQMKCQGKWTNVYLALDNQMFTGIFDGYDRLKINQKDCDSIEIQLIEPVRQKNKTVSLPRYAPKEKLKMNFSDDSLRVHQRTFSKHFVATFEKQDKNLLIGNEYASGFGILEIMQQCQLPAIDSKNN